jgi:hypothetical protein
MSLDARIIGVIGASMQGKGLYIKQEILGKDFKRHNPIIIWSPYEHRDNYTDVIKGKRVHSFVEFGAVLRAGYKRIVFVPANDEETQNRQFDKFCGIVWHIKDALLIVEELSLVTKPGWAPLPWKKISTGGRGELACIVGVSQRPQGMDKDFLGNCTEIRCYRVNSQGAVKAMADAMFVDKTQIAGLQQFHYIHRLVNKGKNTPGVVKIPGSAKKETPKPTPPASVIPQNPAIP